MALNRRTFLSRTASAIFGVMAAVYAPWSLCDRQGDLTETNDGNLLIMGYSMDINGVLYNINGVETVYV